MIETGNLPAGTIVHLYGIPVELGEVVTVKTELGNWQLINDEARREQQGAPSLKPTLYTRHPDGFREVGNPSNFVSLAASPPAHPMTRLDEIAQRAENATKGPWHSPGLGEVHSDHDHGIYVRVLAPDEPDPVVADLCGDADAEFIAHAREDIPYLLAEVRRLDAEKVADQRFHERYKAMAVTLEAEVRSLQQQLAEPNIWICQTCGFTLTKAFLRAANGAVGVDSRDVEDVCPNDGTSMRRQTYRESADAASKTAVDLMERLNTANVQLAEAQQQLTKEYERNINLQNAWEAEKEGREALEKELAESEQQIAALRQEPQQ